MRISVVMQVNSCSMHMGRPLQTQIRLYSLTNPNPGSSAPLWKVRLQASVKKSDPWSLLPHQDFGEATLAELLPSLEFLFVGWKQKFPFSFVLLVFFFFWSVNSNTFGHLHSVALGCALPFRSMRCPMQSLLDQAQPMAG